MIFDVALWRFAASGTLILLYGLADHAARRRDRDPLRTGSRAPRGLALIIVLSLLAFYLTIGPHGRALAGGFGNLAGIALALAAMTLRLTAHRVLSSLRMPDVASRALFYVALPIAVGSLPGLLLLTLPALATSMVWCREEDRRLLALHGERWRVRMSQTRRLVPGVW